VYKPFFKYSLVVLLGILVLNCSNSNAVSEEIVAEVGQNKLYASDLTDIIPAELNRIDSVVLADDYINKWIKQELLIQKANENLTPEQKDVSRELNEYRNSLIIYKYKNELMKQRMDTTVSKEQIEAYYNANPGNLKLSRNIVKAIFVKIPNEFANPSLLKSMVADTSDEGLNELRDFCVQYAKGFDIFIENWVDFETVKNNIPQEIENTAYFLANNNQIESSDSVYYYLVRIQNYKLQNDLAPLSYVQGNIKNLILNQRKIEFLKEIEENIYTEGIRNNRFKVVNNE